MGALFKDMDLYKAIILVACVLLPVGGYLVYDQGNQLKEAENALRVARQPNGHVEKIGQLHAELKRMRNSVVGNLEDHRSYFEKRVLNASRNRMAASDFQIGTEKHVSVRKMKADDVEVGLTFKVGREDKQLSRELVNAIVFNCESQSKAWKLRELHIESADESLAAASKGKAPLKTVIDNWVIKKMTFARRQPESR